MLLEFSVGNFRSIHNMQTLSLVAQPLKSRYKWLDNNKIEVGKGLEVLKSKAIFGANASGKSNLIKAFALFARIVMDSVKNESILSNLLVPFMLNEESISEPTFFQLQFILDGVQYRYGFEATTENIYSEWLFGYPNGKEVRYFTREGQKIDVNKEKFKEGKKFTFLFDEENDIVRENSLFISAVGSLNGKLSKRIVKYISGIIVVSGLHDSFMKNIAYKKLEEDDFREQVVHFMNEAGIKIDNLVVKTFNSDDFEIEDEELMEALSKERELKSIGAERSIFDNEGNLVSKVSWSFEDFESDGTQKMLHLSPFIIDALREGRPLILDEFEARLHTKLARAVVDIFNSVENNPNNSQFVFSTHDTNLLSAKLLRRDQISFVKKNNRGETYMYSLSDIKGVRNDESYEKNYLLGKYDSVPEIGDLSLPVISKI